MNNPDPEPPALPPARIPFGVWVGYYAVVGGWAGWCGNDLWTWQGAGAIVAFTVLVACAGFCALWWREAHITGDYHWRGLLAVLVAYGFVGGVLFGVFNLLPATMITTCVRHATDANFRLGSGGVLGAMLGAFLAWNSRRNQRRDPTSEPSPAANETNEENRS